MHAFILLYYYGGGNFVFPIIILVLAVVRLIIRLSRTSTPAKPMHNPYQQNPYQQNPYQQNQNMGYNPGTMQDNPYNPGQPFPQANNPFTPNPPVVPPNPYNNNQFIPPPPPAPPKDSFSQFSGSTPNTDESGFYCRYCAKKFSSLDALQRDVCFKHPKSEMGLQKHEWYTGVGKPNVGF